MHTYSDYNKFLHNFILFNIISTWLCFYTINKEHRFALKIKKIKSRNEVHESIAFTRKNCFPAKSCHPPQRKVKTDEGRKGKQLARDLAEDGLNLWRLEKPISQEAQWRESRQDFLHVITDGSKKNCENRYNGPEQIHDFFVLSKAWFFFVLSLSFISTNAPEYPSDWFRLKFSFQIVFGISLVWNFWLNNSPLQ